MGIENDITEDWVNTTLGEVCEIKYGKDHKKLNVGDIPCYGSGGLMRRVNEVLYDKPSVLIPRKGTLSNLFFVDEPFWTVDTLFYTKINSSKITPKYLFYKLKTYDLESLNVGSAVPSLTTSVLNQFPFSIPTIPEQKAIAKVLTAFDDKIELLQAQNKTLETMAQTIFKEWFGKYQIGDELPEGWRVGKFGEVIEFINGYAFKSKDLSKEPIEDSFKVFKMGDIKKGGGFNPGKTKGYFPRTLSQKLDKYILKNGDLLMSMTDMKDAISLLGHTALMIYDNEYIVNQRVGLIRANNDIDIEYPYLYLLTNNEDFIAGIRASANSGVQVNLSTQGIKETEFIIADKETNKAFNKIVMPLFEKRKANTLMIKELKKTRDTLLPKLMSGQVRVKNIKQTADA
ncbi:restriction endonuclease subunit S [bacterium]|nr:restriction endonuclease subunit S [bacterium]